jgi:hypothetical protein
LEVLGGPAITILTAAKLVWPSLWTLVGLAIGVLGLITGGHVERRGRVVEFHGGAATWLLERFPGEPMAMTLGHVVLGVSGAALAVSRLHELIHVRQYERWGPFFIPAYLLCSLVLWLRGRDAYHDNPFEREAFLRQ